MPGSAQQAETSSADVLSHYSQGQVRWACKSILAQHTKQFSFFVQFKRLKKKKNRSYASYFIRFKGIKVHI